MNKQKLSKQDHWLIQEWAKARQFEDAMESARQHYADLFREVYERVKKNWQELREYTPHRLAEKVTESAWEDGGGCVGFSELNWCRRWAALGLVGDTVGNLSFRTGNGFLINRTAGDLGGITRQEFVEVIEADREKRELTVAGLYEPSSESLMHAGIYAARLEVDALAGALEASVAHLRRVAVHA